MRRVKKLLILLNDVCFWNSKSFFRKTFHTKFITRTYKFFEKCRNLYAIPITWDNK